MTLVKTCGLRTVAEIDLACRLNVAFVGFVHFAKSPRHLSLDEIANLTGHMRTLNDLYKDKMPKTVCVVVDPDDVLLSEIKTKIAPDFIQLHGHESPEQIQSIRDIYDFHVIKSVSVATRVDIEAGLRFEPVVEHLLFDAKTPKDAPLPGGMGIGFDWSLLEGIKTKAPYFLAGGLNIDTIDEALNRTNAPMVDVSSGLERVLGLKDASLMKAFIERVQAH